jgi:TolB-like protein/DNA-binding winged helix-turn-helix (wHTH) protein/Tfp pilus assembly protein PilF
VSTTAGGRLISFGVFEIDLRTQELRKSGNVIKLANQPFRILAMLASRPGEMVTREDIQREIWGGETFVDFEQGVNHCIKSIRNVLNDDPQNPRYIETLPRRGYRFIAPVQLVEPTGLHEAAAPENGAVKADERTGETKAIPGRYWRWAFFGLVLMAIVVGTAWWRSKERGEPVGKTVAVLPFKNMTGDVGQEFMSDGMTEELSTRLAEVNPEQMAVISRTSAYKYKNTEKGATQIGNELGADYLVEGSVRSDAGRVRITAQLIRVSDQEQMWAASYDRDPQSVLKLESEVADEIAGIIKVKVAGGPGRDNRQSATSWEAYSAYLKGRHLLLDTKTEQDMRLALQYFEEATKHDPRYALGYTGLADGYMELAGFGIPPQEAYTKAREAVTKALLLDPGLAEAHVTLGNLYFYADWNVAEAEREYKKAISLKPQYEEAHHSYSHLLMYLGRHDESIAASERLLRLDPLSPHMNAHLGLAYVLAGRNDDAISQLNKTVEQNPGYIRAYRFLGVAYLQKGETKRAVDAQRQAVALAAGSTEALSDLAHALARSGDIKQANEILEQLKKDAKRRFVADSEFAVIYVGLGRNDEALASLEKAVATHERMVTLNAEPRWAPLKDDPRFKSLVRRSGLRY